MLLGRYTLTDNPDRISINHMQLFVVRPGMHTEVLTYDGRPNMLRAVLNIAEHFVVECNGKVVMFHSIDDGLTTMSIQAPNFVGTYNYLYSGPTIH